MLVRIYTAPASKPIDPASVRVHGGNVAWFDTDEPKYTITIKNLLAARNASGNLSYVVFTSQLAPWSIDDTIRSLLGSSFPPGFYDF